MVESGIDVGWCVYAFTRFMFNDVIMLSLYLLFRYRVPSMDELSRVSSVLCLRTYDFVQFIASRLQDNDLPTLQKG